MAQKPYTKETLSHDEAIAELNTLSRECDDLKEEFKAFTYIVSHDLQAPLRGIVSFSELLCERYQDSFDEKGNKHFGYVIDGGRQMQEMVSGLLHYSRLNTQDKPFEKCSLSELIGEAERQYHKQIAASKAVLHKPDILPEISCDREQMIQVFAALLDNALKFQPAGGTPEICIDVESQESGYQISVRDNGIGIPPDQSEEVFNVFKRLNKPGEYPGIGMGLALAKKIIERHGGRIWIESEPDKGSTVYLAIPFETSDEHDTS